MGKLIGDQDNMRANLDSTVDAWFPAETISTLIGLRYTVTLAVAGVGSVQAVLIDQQTGKNTARRTIAVKAL